MHTANFRADTKESNSKISTTGALGKVRKHNRVKSQKTDSPWTVKERNREQRFKKIENKCGRC